MKRTAVSLSPECGRRVHLKPGVDIGTLPYDDAPRSLRKGERPQAGQQSREKPSLLVVGGFRARILT